MSDRHRQTRHENPLKIGSFRQEACAGAPAPPRWNASGFGAVKSQDHPDQFFTAPGAFSLEKHE